MSTHDLSLKQSVTSRKGVESECFGARCSCRWRAPIYRATRAEAEADHAEHVAAFEAITVPLFAVGDKVRFDGKRTTWRVRAHAAGGRYVIATCSMFGDVYYTVMDRLEEVRGPLNVIGGGVGIDTTDGPDTGIDAAVRMLEARPDPIHAEYDGLPYDPEEWDTSWEVSRRNRVRLDITDHIPAR